MPPKAIVNNGFNELVQLAQKGKSVAKYLPGQNIGTSSTTDITMCLQNIPVIAPNGYSRYVWNDGALGQSRTLTDVGAFWVSCIGGCGQPSVTENIIVSNDGCDCKCNLPGAFTPNGDGVNDFYFPVIEGCDINSFSFSVYNRWGNRVFHSNNPESRWDGKYHGVPQEMGVFMYQLEYTTGQNNAVHRLKGNVTLIR